MILLAKHLQQVTAAGLTPKQKQEDKLIDQFLDQIKAAASDLAKVEVALSKAVKTITKLEDMEPDDLEDSEDDEAIDRYGAIGTASTEAYDLMKKMNTLLQDVENLNYLAEYKNA